MNWERSETFGEFFGCLTCLHWRSGMCVAYPDRIPLPILSGQVDHLVPRPGQVGNTVYQEIDFERWQQTGERVPVAVAARLSPRSA